MSVLTRQDVKSWTRLGWLFGVAFAACQSPSSQMPDLDASLSRVGLNGRVVNFETCMHADCCRAVEGVTVRLRDLEGYSSSPTGLPGRFDLRIPSGHEDHLVVEPEGLSFAPTINPWTAPAAISDVYGIELFTLPTGSTEGGRPTLLQALSGLPEPFALVEEGGYVGQVNRIDEAGDSHAVQGAAVTVTVPDDWPPAQMPEVRYVGSIPQYDEGDVLLERGYPATGSPGIFIISTRSQTGLVTVHVETVDTVFTEIVAPVEPGAVTFAIHVP